MKKYIIFILTAAIIMLSLPGLNMCCALSDTEFILNTDDDIEVGKSFNVYLSVSSSDVIGVFRAEISFDSSALTFKSAKIKDGSDGYIKYNSDGDKVIFIYLNTSANENGLLDNLISFKFSPVSSEEASYSFNMLLYEIGDINANQLEVSELPELTVNITKNRSTTSTGMSKTSVDTSDSSVLSDSSDTESLDFDSSGNSAYDNIESDVIDSEYLSDTAEVSADANYIIYNSENVKFRQDSFYICIFAVFVIAAAIVIAFKLGQKNINKNPDNEKKPDTSENDDKTKASESFSENNGNEKDD